MIEPILALFEVQVEGCRRDAVELLEASLGRTPETLNTVDGCRASHELVLTMMDSKVLGIPDINQAVVTTPALSVDDGVACEAAAHNGL